MYRFKGKVNTYIPKIMERKVYSSSIHNGKKESEGRSVVSDSLQPHGLFSSWNFPGENTGVGSLSLLRGVFPTQGLNPGLRHCRRILYQLNHKGSPRILEWVSFPFSRGSSWPRDRTWVSCIEGGFFTSWATGEDQYQVKGHLAHS